MTLPELLRKNIAEQIYGQSTVVDLCLACFLSGGHLLIEGPPGTGKTSLAHALAASFSGEFRRIQMTSDLLPSDILGITRLKMGSTDFEFRRGPVFANVVLADELNRTNPKTQTALLEAMAEHKVTVDGVSHALPKPFFVVATQNPFDSEGVYPVTESQLDRFMMQVELSIPEGETEMEIFRKHVKNENKQHASKSLSLEDIKALQEKTRKLFIEDSVLEYAQAIVTATRSAPGVKYGVSVRGALQFLDAARGHALLHGRDFVVPADLAVVAPYVLAHRLCFSDTERAARERQGIIHEILKNTRAPK